MWRAARTGSKAPGDWWIFSSPVRGQLKSNGPQYNSRILGRGRGKSAVLNSLTSTNSKRSYHQAIREFIDWYCSEPGLAFNRTVVTRYRITLEQHPYAPSTVNLRLAEIHRLTYEASDCGLLSPDLAAGIRGVKGVPRLGMRVVNWLTAEEGKKLLGAETADCLRGRIGWGLRGAGVTTSRVEDLQLREGQLGHR